MKLTLLIIIGLYRIILSEGRLITRNLKLTTEITTKSAPPLRIARDISEDDTLMGFSKENIGPSDEFIQTYNKKTKYLFKFRPAKVTPTHKIARVPRGSIENTTTTIKNCTYSESSGSNQKLVKKPIPKFSDIEYDDDFQDKVNRSPIRVADSNEHEDEDFNLGDYDFDVNHDEFAGRGKPLEPINKVKEVNPLILLPQPSLPTTTNTKTADVKLQSKFHASALDRAISNKRERAIANEKVSNKIINKIKDDDYYDDKTTKDITKETKLTDPDDDMNEENEESKEFERKIWSARMARSVWNISNVKSREKTSARVSKVLSILPMFPQVPYDRQLNSNVKYVIVS